MDNLAAPSPSAAWIRLALPLVLALATATAVMFAPQILNDGDTLWQRMVGEWMVQHRAVMRVDPFTFTHAGLPWIAQEWIGEISGALAYRAGGWAGVMALTGIATGAAIGILSAYLVRRLTPVATVVTVVLVLGCMAPSLLARPHVLVWPLTVLWVIGLLDARERNTAPSLWMPPLLCLWANMHGSAVLALGLLAPFALEALVAPGADRKAVLIRWGAFGLGALGAAMLTPHGLYGVLYPFIMMARPSVYFFISEWGAADFSRLSGLELALMATLYVCLARGVRVPPLRLVLLLGMLHLALQHSRHGPLLALVAALVLAAPLSAIAPAPPAPALPARRGWIMAGAAAALLLAVLALRLSQPVALNDGPTRPVVAVAHVPPQLRAQRVFNEFGFGGYLIESGVAPFIDGRTDMQRPEVVAAYEAAAIRADPKALAATLDGYQIQWTLLYPDSQVAAEMDRLPGWRRVWTDRYAVVHMREGGSLR